MAINTSGLKFGEVSYLLNHTIIKIIYNRKLNTVCMTKKLAGYMFMQLGSIMHEAIVCTA